MLLLPGGIYQSFVEITPSQQSAWMICADLLSKIKIYKRGVNMKQSRWIPITETLPDNGRYILLSFENYVLPDIGRYEVDNKGDGAFYPGDSDKSYASWGVFVNAWMELPKAYREREEENNGKKKCFA